ncbi:MAG: alkaline phosphatase family protein [Calditrichaeota bacterium]|nr:MAG: alkaline phosphatase family protein [Calditrichota bacterium]
MKADTLTSRSQSPNSISPFYYLFSIYFIGLIVFYSLRFFFYINFPENTADLTSFEIITAFLIGIRFDQIVVLIIMTPLFIVVPWMKRFSKLFLNSVSVYITILFSFIIIVSLADIRFFKYIGAHLNFLVFEYIDEGTSFTDTILSDSKILLYSCIWIVGTIITFLMVQKSSKTLKRTTIQYRFISRILITIPLYILVFIGIRGSLGVKPLDWGAAYFSDKPFLNQLALNGIYTLGRTLTEKNHDPRLIFKDETERFPFVDFDDGLRSVERMLSQPNQVWDINSKELKREILQPDNTYGFQPNVILVVMEGWSGEYTGVLGSDLNLTPNFDSLSERGIIFTDFYATGTRTNFGLISSLCSYPSLPGRAIMKRYNAYNHFNSLPEILSNRGYTNLFMYGGDLSFDNMQGYFKTKEVHNFIGQSDFDSEDVFSIWGATDKALYSKLLTVSDTLSRPFFTTALTLSNHKPFDLPDSSLQVFEDDSFLSQIYNAIHYADYAVGQFLKEISQKPYFDSTIILFVPDHTQLGNSKGAIEPNNFHIPFLIYSPLVSSQIIHTTGSQVDITPTLMHLLGGHYNYKGWGRNLFIVDSTDGFAVVNANQRTGIITKDYLYKEDIGISFKLKLRDSVNSDMFDLDEIQSDFRIYLQIADQLSLKQTIE